MSNFAERFAQATETRAETATRHAWAGKFANNENQADASDVAKLLAFATTTVITAATASFVAVLAYRAIVDQFAAINAALAAAGLN